MGTRVVHVSDHVPGAVYVGRRNRWAGCAESPFANPFVIGRDGTREEVVAKYRTYIAGRPDLLAQAQTLRGKPLACWCRRDGEARTDDNACHADVLVELVGSG